jgi:hypothetical protein
MTLAPAELGMLRLGGPGQPQRLAFGLGDGGAAAAEEREREDCGGAAHRPNLRS